MLMLILRLVHILSGVFWVGAVFTVALFIQPAIAALGPEGGKVMGALIKRRFLDIVPVAAVAAVASGLWLYALDSSGFQGVWMRTPMGMALGTGATLAVVGLLIGMLVMRASTLKAMALGQSAAQLTDAAARDAAMQQVQELRARAALAVRTVAVLLALTVIAMAVARYL
jgi:uncharacterized membrane protein